MACPAGHGPCPGAAGAPHGLRRRFAGRRLRMACGGGSPDAGSVETDREALVALYNATDGENWDNNDNWLSDAPLGEWYGVTTDDNGRVTWLELAGNQLSGEIPPVLGSLANLEWLWLSGNQLNGEIPPVLGSLANLEWLWLSGNQLNGEIPPELGSLANLVVLWLHENQLSGEIQPELGSLANLKELVLYGNELSGCVPGSLEGQLGIISSFRGLPFCP